MPLYDYRCTQCAREVEVMHGIHETGPEVCESCGGAMRKALSSPAIHFKGSGWAKKDAAASARKPKPASSDAKTDTSGKTAKGETKSGDASDRSAKGSAEGAGSSDKAASSGGAKSD